MARALNPRARAAREHGADTVARAAALVRDGHGLDEGAAGALAQLLDHLAGPVRDSTETLTWDAVMRLAELVVAPHRDEPETGRPLPSGYVPAHRR